jgi:hypothetical protein
MTLKTFAIVLVTAAVLVSGILAMHGRGHAALARWLPSLHGAHAR